MNRSEQINELAAALSKAQGQMEGAEKAQQATVTTKTGSKYTYNYATMASIVDAVRAPFSDNGLSFTQLPVWTEGQEVRVETVLLHVSGQWIASEIRIPVSVGDAQGFGSAFTYACKYGLRAIAGVPAVEAEDDDGAAAVKAKPRATEAEMTPRAVGLGKLDKQVTGNTLYEGEPRRDDLPTTPPRTMKFTISKAQYLTAGMTETQMRQSFELVPLVNERYGKGKAEGLLRDEFKVVSRSDLTEAQAEQYLTRLIALKEAV